MNLMTYKGYAARIEYSDEDEAFVGHIAGIHDVVGFHGESVSDLRAAFVEAVDDYLEACEKLGRTPQKPYSGKIMLRVDPAPNAPPLASSGQDDCDDAGCCTSRKSVRGAPLRHGRRVG